VQLYPVASLHGRERKSAQQKEPFVQTAQDFRIVDLERRIDEFDEIHGLSHPLYKEGSSTDAFV
jgi:hypothetical protein